MEPLLTTDACTLPTAERPMRLAELDALFAEHVRTVDREGERVRLHLTGPTGLRSRVADLADRESSCCSFFTFDIEGDDQALVLDITVPPAQRDILDALADRAAQLSR